MLMQWFFNLNRIENNNYKYYDNLDQPRQTFYACGCPQYNKTILLSVTKMLNNAQFVKT